MSDTLPGKRHLGMLSRLIRGVVSAPRPLVSGTSPRLEASLLPSTRGRLEIVRDARGVPHVYGEHERDVFAALGFLQGADRFTFLDLIRHLGAGRYSELFGNLAAPQHLDMIGGKRVSEIDAFIRPLGFEAEAAAAFARLGNRERDCLEGFADGVNAALRAMNGIYPLEYLFFGAVRPWSPADCLLAARTCAFVVTLAGLEHELCVDAVRGHLGDAEARLVYPTIPWESAPTSYAPCDGPTPHLGLEPPPGSGSNNWAIGGSRSAAGAPIVANDPHVPLIPLPTFWYHAHLECPRFRVQGGIFPGFPAFGYGHNGALAWGCTTGFRDGWDLCRIHRVPGDRSRYRTPDGTGAIRPRRETLYARFGQSVVHEWEECEHGVIYLGWKHHDGVDLAVRFVSTDLAIYVEGCLDLMADQTVDGHRAAVAKLNEGPFDFNHTYAHKDGHFGWEVYGRSPRRPKDGLFVRDAHDPDAQWLGFVPFGEMPKILNPERGYVATANSYTDAENYESIATLSHFEPRYRQDRIEHRLSERNDHNWQSMASIQADVVAEIGPALRDSLLTLLQPLEGAVGEVGDALSALRDWNGEFRAESGSAAIFYFLISNLALELFTAVFDKELGLRFATGPKARPRLFMLLLDEADPLRAVARRRSGRSLDEMAARSLEGAVAHVVRVCGREPAKWRWGAIQRAWLAAPLGIVPAVGKHFVALDGDLPGYPYTVNPYISVPVGDRLYGLVGPTSRFICDLSRPDEAWFAHSSGHSGDAFSSWFATGSHAWLRGEYFLSALWKPEDVPDVVERVVVHA